MEYELAEIHTFNDDLTKAWHVEFTYYSKFEQKDKRVRWSNQANRSKSRVGRMKILQELKESINLLLKLGWTPENPIELKSQDPEGKDIDLQKALTDALEVRKNEITPKHFSAVISKVDRLKSWLIDKELLQAPVENFKKRHVTLFLSWILEQKNDKGQPFSKKTRNNYLGEIRSLFEKMIDLEYLDRNPTKGISNLTATTTKHVPYTAEEFRVVSATMEELYPYLKLFSGFIYYAFLRPVEITRLRRKDIDFDNRLIYLRADDAKNASLQYIPIIDQLLDILEAMDIKSATKNDYLFTTKKRFGATQVYATNYFSDKYVKVKNAANKKGLSLTENHTLYGLRHTMASFLYNQFLKSMTREQAEFELMQITRHKSVVSLRKYLRAINAKMPRDWSAEASLLS